MTVVKLATGFRDHNSMSLSRAVGAIVFTDENAQPSADNTAPSIYTALQEQLGLKLLEGLAVFVIHLGFDVVANGPNPGGCVEELVVLKLVGVADDLFQRDVLDAEAGRVVEEAPRVGALGWL